MDRFNTDEDEKFNSRFEEPDVFSTCSNPLCMKEILLGDEYIDYYGLIACNNLICLIATTDSVLKVAGEDD